MVISDVPCKIHETAQLSKIQSFSFLPFLPFLSPLLTVFVSWGSLSKQFSQFSLLDFDFLLPKCNSYFDSVILILLLTSWSSRQQAHLLVSRLHPVLLPACTRAIVPLDLIHVAIHSYHQ